jgi:hypothetical protein
MVAVGWQIRALKIAAASGAPRLVDKSNRAEK